MLRRCSLLVVFVCVWAIVFSQGELRISLQSGSVIPPTAQQGTSFNINVSVINADIDTFSGVISLGYSIGDSTYYQSDTTSGVSFPTFNGSILPTDSIPINGITVKVTGPKFSVGPSVVVIWPIAINADALDSLRFTLDVTTSINDPFIEDDLRMFLLNGSLFVYNPQSRSLNYVRVYDLQGRLVQAAEHPTQGLPMGNTEAGIYIAELNYENGKRKTFRFVNR